MSLIGAIVIAASMDTSKLAKNADSARKSLNDFGKGLVNAKTLLVGFGAALAGSAVVKGLSSMVTTSNAAMVAMSRNAAEVGVGVQAYSRLAYAAEATGSSTEDLQKGLATMNATLRDAAAFGGPAATALAKVGLDAEYLKRLSPDEAFKKISDGFAGIKDPAEKATLAFQVFGAEGASILKTLAVGSDDLNKLGKEADNLGVSFDDLAAQSAVQAQSAFTRLGKIWEGVSNIVAVKLTPYLTVAADTIVDLTSNAMKSGGILSRAFEGVIGAADVLLDQWGTLKAVWFTLQAVVTGGLSLLVGGFNQFGKAVEKVLNLIPGISVEFDSVVGEVEKDLAKLSGESWDKAKRALAEPPGEGLGKFLSKVQKGATDAATALQKAAGATRGMDAATLSAMKLNQQYAESAKSIYEETRSPLEKYAKRMFEIQQAVDKGGLDQLSANRAKVQAGRDLGLGEKRNIGALEANTTEARSALLNYNNQSRGTGLKDVAKNTARQVQIQEASLRELQKIAGVRIDQGKVLFGNGNQ